MSNNYYSDSFKNSVVRQVLEGGDTISQVARNNDITNVSLRRWIEKYKNSEDQSSDDLETQPHSEVEILKQHLNDVTNERDILKAALLIIASEANYNESFGIKLTKINKTKR